VLLELLEALRRLWLAVMGCGAPAGGGEERVQATRENGCHGTQIENAGAYGTGAA
jgi:hypothetical protein